MGDTELLSSSDQKMDDASAENPTIARADALLSDDSGESDSDSEDEAESNQQIETLETELSTNPYNYDAYVQYIKILRKTANLEKLRQAREAMSAIFPLSPSLWIEWARDEASLASSEKVPEIVMLYERGLSDYQSVSLWCDYLNFLIEFDPSVHGYTSDGISKLRSLFERAIPAAGFHVTEGNRIWEGYREYEQGVLGTIDEADVEERNKQVQRIRSIFHRNLSVPLENLSSTLNAYKAWELEQGVDLDIGSDDLSKASHQVAAANKKAQQMYSERAHLEERISKKDISDTEKFQEFMNYIKFEKTSGDPTRVQAIYERAVAEYPVSSDLWVDYTLYLDKTLKVGKPIRHAYSRATRSCPWTGDLWARFLLALERGSASEKEIYAVFEKSLQCTFTSFEEYLDLYLTRVDGLRRKMLSTRVVETLDYSLIRDTFQQASDYLTPHMQNTDSLIHLHTYWANLELNLGKDLAGARGVWDNFLKKSGGILAAWHAYIDMEVRLGHIKEARSIYQRCYTRKFDGNGSEDICKGWLRFERDHGDLEDFDHAFQKVMPRLEELQLIRLQQESTAVKLPAGLKEHNSQKSTREKRKAGPNVENESLAKRQKRKGKKVNEADIESQTATVPNIKNVKAENGKVGDSKMEESEDGKPVKSKVYTDECTDFLSNLNVKAQEEDIHKCFSDVGGVDSIRILHLKDTGKPRGLASSSLLHSERDSGEGASNAPLDADISKEKQMEIHGNVLENMGGAVAMTSSSAGRVAVSSDSIIASTELEKNNLLQSSLDSNEVSRNASDTICGSQDVSIAHNSKQVPLLTHITDKQDSDNSSRLSGGHGKSRKLESDNVTIYADNEGKKDDKGDSNRKKRGKRRKKRSSSRSMTISQRLGAIDKTTTDIDLGILDALELATKVAQEVAREVNSGEPSHSSSEELSDESEMSGSQNSLDDDVHTGSPSKGLSVGENHSFEKPHVADDDIMDEKNDKPENGMMNSDDAEESHLAEAAKPEVSREKSPCGFDLNQDVCPDETDVVMSTTATLMSVSHSVASSGMPAAALLQLERSLSRKGSATTSEFHPALPQKVPSEDLKEKQVMSRGINLNVAEVGDDQVEDLSLWKQFPLPSLNSRGGECSHEANLRGSSRFNLDLNCMNEDDEMPPPSELKMETRLFLTRSGQQSASHFSSSAAQQSGKKVNFDLNDRQHFFIESRDQGPYYGRHPWSTVPYGGHTLEEQVIPVLSRREDVDRKDTVSQMASFLSNGKSLEPAGGLYMGRTGNSLGLGPGVSFSPASMYGYNGLTGPPGLSMSSPMYVPGSTIPYIVDSRGASVMMPQIIGSTLYVQPPFPQQHMFINSAGGSPSLNGSVRPNFDQSSGFSVETGNREPLSLRQFLSPVQSGALGEHSGANVEPSSSSSISIGGKRKEP